MQNDVMMNSDDLPSRVPRDEVGFGLYATHLPGVALMFDCPCPII
jgi:hypothetical protein